MEFASVGNVVFKIRESYYSDNPYDFLRINYPYSKVETLGCANTYLHMLLSRLEKYLLLKDTDKVTSLVKDILEFLDSKYKSEVERIGIKESIEYYTKWSLLWILKTLCKSFLIEDLYFAERFCVPLSQHDKEDQYALREQVFNLYDYDEDTLGSVEGGEALSLYLESEG